MPQMSPMLWETLYLIFILSFMIMNTIMYFNFSKKMDMKVMMKLKNMLIWKW
uniref:ATP synthase F0 subunit 8 n=1 Tax=Pirkimerus japonicus TaxID=2869168 RepID=UPI002176E121|nr:ATP synthase F0 subunit 8 [Pirkimerus japonicus]UUJ37832.1 ATP synthase F0 subunit 8 [Pirkimerus japonicus]